MICSKCGKKIDDDALFCEFCGAKVENISTDISTKEEKKGETKSSEDKPKNIVENTPDIKVKEDKNVTAAFKVEAEKIVEETIQSSETKDDAHDNFLIRFIKKSVGELEEGPILKNKFVMFCIGMTVLVVLACIIIGLIYDINIARSIHDIG